MSIGGKIFDYTLEFVLYYMFFVLLVFSVCLGIAIKEIGITSVIIAIAVMLFKVFEKKITIKNSKDTVDK